jgi:hypothetical protein
MPCRKQKRAARKEVLSKKMMQHATRHTHEEVGSTLDLSTMRSVTTHSVTTQLSTVQAPRRRHLSPNHIPIKTFGKENWHDVDSCSMVLDDSNYVWSTPDKDDYHGDCTGSTLVRADLRLHNGTSDDHLKSPAALRGQHVNTDQHEIATNDSFSNFSPPVPLGLHASTDYAAKGSVSLAHTWSVHSHADYSSDILLPLPPSFDSDQ